MKRRVRRLISVASSLAVALASIAVLGVLWAQEPEAGVDQPSLSLPQGGPVAEHSRESGAISTEGVTLLFVYLGMALVFSFLCSVFEAVLLSIRRPYVASERKNNSRNADTWEHLMADINRPLSSILILNTVANTAGAAGVGAQAASLFGNHFTGLISAILTVLILVFSEIIPKTLGAVYWRRLAPSVGKLLSWLTTIMTPLVWMTEKITSGISHGEKKGAFSREEFTAMADIAHSDGSLEVREMAILKNLLSLRYTKLGDVMTPNTVVFSLPETTTVREFVERHSSRPFSRIPVYADNVDEITGFVLRSDIFFSAVSSADTAFTPISAIKRDLKALPESMPISKAFDVFLGERTHISLVVDEFGAIAGIVTLEDIVETLLGLEIMDEVDRTEDMQALARRLWKVRAEQMGIVVEEGTSNDHSAQAQDDPPAQSGNDDDGANR